MRTQLRHLSAVAICAGLISPSMLHPGRALAAVPPRPPVLELYTSEGCSSCPAAEALVGQLLRDPDLLPLAFHVDYWDSQGWRDRFSLSAATQRQHEWGRHFGAANIYTPQMIIDGRRSVLGSDGPAIVAAVRDSLVARRASQSMVIEAAVADGQLQVELTGECLPADATKVAILVQDSHSGGVRGARVLDLCG